MAESSYGAPVLGLRLKSDEVAGVHTPVVSVAGITGTVGSSAIANGQVATSTTSALAVAARATRRRVILKNLDAAITIYIGTGTVSAANGMPLLAGESIALETSSAINAIAASVTPSLAYIEEYS